MATIERFEQIISWQEARILNKIIGDLIDGDRFKKSFRLITQLKALLVQSWIILQRALREVEIKNSFNSYI